MWHLEYAAPETTHQSNYIQGAVDGTLNVLKQATVAGVKKLVLTSSVVTSMDFDKWQEVMTDRVYGPDG